MVNFEEVTKLVVTRLVDCIAGTPVVVVALRVENWESDSVVLECTSQTHRYTQQLRK
jgi:hypothetical protein